ncbi:MAG: hypothetical protein U0136_04955 [Bdellovibrionota bacterium]
MRHLLTPQAYVRPTWNTTNARQHRAKVFDVLERRGSSRQDNGPSNGVVRMLACELLNFAQDPYAIGVPEDLWTLDNITARARHWLSSQHHADSLCLPTDIDELICHPQFLRAHGAPTQIRLLSNDVIDVESANFDAEFGEGACLAVLRHLSTDANENTRPLRLKWDRSRRTNDDTLLDALPAVSPRVSIPGLVASGTLTCIENVFEVEVLECLGFAIPGLFPLLMLFFATTIFVGVSSSARG